MSKKSNDKFISITNRKAKFEYELLNIYTAGIQLQGTEIKSLREGNANLTDSYCYIQNGEAWINGMYIAEYDHGSYMNHEPKRLRKLLLNKKEINKLNSAFQDVGVTIVPLKLYITDKGWAKIEIALAKGKKLFDKREDLKRKDDKRQIDRALKEFK